MPIVQIGIGFGLAPCLHIGVISWVPVVCQVCMVMVGQDPDSV